MSVQLPPSMKAAQWSPSAGGLVNSIKPVEVPLPAKFATVPQGYTLVKISHATLNPVDIKFAEVPIFGRFVNRIPGSDFAGEVVSSTFCDLKIGDKVFGKIKPPAFGALAEYALVEGRDNVITIPDGVKASDAAALGVCALAAYQAVVPFVRAGNRVLINGGSGGVGTFAIQIAKIVGCKVTAICSGQNIQLCQALGADHVIDYSEGDVVTQLKQSNMLYDLLFDAVGTPNIYYNAHHYAQPSAIFNTVALDPSSFRSIRQTALMYILPRFLGGGSRRIQAIGAKADKDTYARLVQWLKQGKLRAQIDSEYNLNEIGEGFSRLKTGRSRGKLVVHIL